MTELSRSRTLRKTGRCGYQPRPLSAEQTRLVAASPSEHELQRDRYWVLSANASDVMFICKFKNTTVVEAVAFRTGQHGVETSPLFRRGKQITDFRDALDT